jgi:hypothetical protein
VNPSPTGFYLTTRGSASILSLSLTSHPTETNSVKVSVVSVVSSATRSKSMTMWMITLRLTSMMMTSSEQPRSMKALCEGEKLMDCPL